VFSFVQRANTQSYALYIVILFFLSFSLEHSDEDLKRLLPRLVREVRRSSVNWEDMNARLLVEEKFVFDAEQPTVKVISLFRAKERQHLTTDSLKHAGIDHALSYAVDGLAPIDETSVATYAGTRKAKRLKLSQHLSPQQILTIYEQLGSSEDVNKEDRLSLHERLRFGCYMSHVMLWETAVKEKSELLVILEDDVFVTADFRVQLLQTLNSLPKNWDILYLNGCFKRFGPAFRKGIRLARGGLCTSAYVISHKGASTLIRGGALHSDKPIDHMLDGEILSRNLVAFHSDPPFVFVEDKFNSTLAY
jgi:GR25 family glycosyltransferase involved in LPS biosynthesis